MLLRETPLDICLCLVSGTVLFLVWAKIVWCLGLES